MDAKESFDDHYEIGTTEYEIMNCYSNEYRYECLEELRKEILNGVWNFLPHDGLPYNDKPVLIFREKYVPEVIGAFYEGNIEHGEFHNGEECPERIVYSDVTAWTDVLEAPKLTDK